MTTTFRTRYATRAEALADGWCSVNRKADRDISGGNFFGYKYQSSDGQDSTTIALTHERNAIGTLGCFVEMFRVDAPSSPNPVPTIEEVLDSAAGPCGTYHWDVEGGRITVTREQLEEALEAAYDPTMPAWPSLVQLDA